MRFERGASNTFTIPARPTTTPSNWLLRFVKVDGGLEVLCIADAYAVSGMPVQLTFTEVSSSPTAVDGEVTLSLGQWHLYVYEQASASNLNFTQATRQPFDTLVEVVGAATPDPEPTDPCAGGGGGDCPFDITVSVNGVEQPIIEDVDPCVNNTLNITITYS